MGGKTYGQAQSIVSALRRGQTVLCSCATKHQEASMVLWITEILQATGGDLELLGRLKTEVRCS